MPKSKDRTDTNLQHDLDRLPIVPARAQQERIEAQLQETDNVIDQSIETIVNLHLHVEKNVDSHQRMIEAITAALGRPRTFYSILVFVVAWCLTNILLPVEHLRSFDLPPFAWLQGLVSLVGLLTATAVLITQRRQAAKDERSRQLMLQINLLQERKITKVIELLEELRQDLPGVRDRFDPEVESMRTAVDPHEVLENLNEMLEESISEKLQDQDL